MPYKSAKQRRYLHANEPALAARWDEKYGGKIAKSNSSGMEIRVRPLTQKERNSNKRKGALGGAVLGGAVGGLTGAEASMDYRGRVSNKATAIGAGIGMVPGALIGRHAGGRKKYEASLEPVGKMGDWKTIEQREAHQRRDKKVQNLGLKGVGFGVGASALALRAGTGPLASQLRNLKTGYQFRHLVPKEQRRATMWQGIKDNPLGATFVGGAGLAATGGAVYAGGRSAQAYHQHKINERRKARVKKADSMPIHDGSPSGFARYGNMSSIGRRQADEFSKAYTPTNPAEKLYRSRRTLMQGNSAARAKALPFKDGQMGLRNLGTEGPEWNAGRTAGERITRLKGRGVSKRLVNIPASHVSPGGKQGLKKLKGAAEEAAQSQWKKGVSKRIRNKDAESDRQRRLGMGIAATGLGATVLGAKGGIGAVRTTRAVRGANLNPSKGYFESLPKEAQDFFRQKGMDGKKVAQRGIAMRGRDAAYLGGAGALGGGAIALDRYARSERNRRWE